MQSRSPAGLIFASEETAIAMAESLEDKFCVVGDNKRDDKHDGEALIGRFLHRRRQRA
jgi:hypothetical protein